jgi:hypothetical protein
VISVGSSSGPSRTASSGRVHEVRPGPSAATKEYGQPGMTCLLPLPRRVAVAEKPLRGGLRVRRSQFGHRRPAANQLRQRGISALACLRSAIAHARARSSSSISARPRRGLAVRVLIRSAATVPGEFLASPGRGRALSDVRRFVLGDDFGRNASVLAGLKPCSLAQPLPGAGPSPAIGDRGPRPMTVRQGSPDLEIGYQGS